MVASLILISKTRIATGVQTQKKLKLAVFQKRNSSQLGSMSLSQKNVVLIETLKKNNEVTVIT